MNIIFTRPLIDAEDLMMNFFSSGHKVIHMPTLSIASVDMNPIMIIKILNVFVLAISQKDL